MQSDTYTKTGFTLIETLVAISVLLIGVVAPLSIGYQAIRASQISKERVEAFYLGQDAVEYVRNVRDTNIREGNSWTQGLEPCLDSVCKIDVPNEIVESCSGSSCEPLRRNSDSGLVGYDNGWSETKYVREVEITSNSNREMIIDVTVSWSTGIFDRSIRIRDNLFKWI